MKNFLIKIWKVLDGNKTIIGLILINLTQISFIKEWLGGDVVAIREIIGVLTGVSGIHHITKGKLTTRKN